MDAQPIPKTSRRKRAVTLDLNRVIKSQPDASNLEAVQHMLEHALEWKRVQVRIMLTLIFVFKFRREYV